MAFCSIEKPHREAMTMLVFNRIGKDPSSLKSFKQFSQEIFKFLLSKGQSSERAITLVKFIPQIVSEYNSIPENRKQLRTEGVSLDAIYDVEETFTNYESLSKYLGLQAPAKPITFVSKPQLDAETKLNEYLASLDVKIVDNKRYINGIPYDIRVTSIAKVGYNDGADEIADAQSSALKHGNTVDSIGKNLFENKPVDYKDYETLMTRDAFDGVVGGMNKVKAEMEKEGYIFKAGVTVFNKKLKISGEIDLLAITPTGDLIVMDFKTANHRFNESYLMNDVLRFKSDNIQTELGMLSKWKQYSTQGSLYGKLLQESTSLPVIKSVGIIGISLVYDDSVDVLSSQIMKVPAVVIQNIPWSQSRTEFKDKNIEEVYKVYKELEGKSLGSITEIKSTNPRRKNLDNPSPRRNLDRMATIEEIAATERELQTEVDWFKSNPIGKDTLLRIDNMVNTGLFGTWSLDGITIYQNASQGTVYHEGWHRFSQVFMSKKQKDELYNSVKDDNIKFKTRDGRRVATANSSDLDIEEFLADQFAKYAVNPTEYNYPTSNSKPKSLFQKIWDFLLRFFGKKNRPIDIFQKLYRGKIAEYIPSVNNAYWGKLNSLAENEKGEEIISNERLPLYTRSMDYLLGEELRRADRTFTSFKQSKVLQRNILDNIYNSLEERYRTDNTLTDEQAEEIYRISQNKFYFTKTYLASTSYDTLKDFALDETVFTSSTEELAAVEEIKVEYENEMDEYDFDRDDKENTKADRFDRPGNEDSVYSLADDPLKDFFRTIPKIKSVNYNPNGTVASYVYTTNELGYPENHTYYDVFYKTKKMLSGAFEIDDLFNRMNDKNNQRIFPELKLVNDYLRTFLDKKEQNFQRAVQHVQFIQSFYHVMTMPEVPNMQLTMNFLPITRKYKTFKPTMVSYKKASRNLSLKIIQTWEKNFKDRRNKEYTSTANLPSRKSDFLNSPLYLTSGEKIMLNPFADFDKLYPLTNKGLKDFYETIGVILNDKVYQDKDSTDKLKEYKQNIIDNIKIYESSKFLELVSLLAEDLAADGVDISDFKDIDEYINAASPDQIDAIASIFFIENPITQFNEKQILPVTQLVNGKEISGEQATESLRFLFEAIADMEELFGERVSSGAFRIEDKTKYPYYIPNQLLITTSLLNSIGSVGAFEGQSYLNHLNPIRNPWMKRSLFYKRMFDQNGERRLDETGKPISIRTDDIASVRMLTEDGIVEKHPRSLNKSEKFFMDALTMFHSGSLEIPRSETSSTIFTIRLTDYGKGQNSPISSRDVLGKAMPEPFFAILKDYMAAEIEKRQWYIKNEPSSKFAGRFNVFQDIISSDLKDKIVSQLGSSADEILSQPDILGQFRKEVEDYFTARVKEVTPRFESLERSPEGLPKDYLTMLKDTAKMQNVQSAIPMARFFIFNQFILNTEFYSLYFGDLQFYKNPFKRGKFVTNTGNTFFMDPVRNQLMNGIQFETLNSILTGDKPGGKDFSNIKTSTMADVEMKSSYVNEDDNKNIILTNIMNMRVQSGALIKNSPEYVAELAKVREVLSKYNSINIADGQGIIGMDFYRNFSIAMNIWSEEKETEYSRQRAIFRSHFNLYFKMEDGVKIPLSPEEEAAARERDRKLIATKTKVFFNPLKISYTGPQSKPGPFTPVFDKFSVRPIIPEAVIGKRDEGMLLEMTRQDIDYVKFQSGSKVHNENIFEWFEKNDDGTYNLNNFTTEEIEPNELQSAYLKYQLSTEGHKEENILGSQFRKIVYGIKYSPLVRNNPQLREYFRDLERNFEGSVRDLLNIEERDLFSLLGIEYKNGNYEVKDLAKFIKVIVNESTKRGIAINNIDYLQYNEITKNAVNPIDFAFNRQQIQDLLAGMIDDKLRRLHINGSSLIQVALAGYENKDIKFINPTQEDIEKYGTSGLHFYHIKYNPDGTAQETSTMGVKVALLGDYTKLLNLPAPEELGESYPDVEISGISNTGELLYSTVRDIKKPRQKDRTGTIGTLERLNAAMKIESWKKEHIDKFIMVGYRIPTQNNNFIDRMEIMEFLPPAAGAIIIPPMEFPAKSGSDFDIDKMNIIRPSLSGTGNIVKKPEQSIDEIYSEIEKLTIDEKELKSRNKEINKLLSNIDTDAVDILKLQRSVRYTILDLVMKTGVSDTKIDQIMENIKTGQKEILPDPSEIEDDLQDFDMDLFKATIKFVQLDKEIQRLGLSETVLIKEKSEIDLSLFDKKRQYKKAINNDMLFNLNKTLSHPYYYELLVTPSSARMYEDLANKLIASKSNMSEEQYQTALEETEGSLYDRVYTPEENTRYERILSSFDNLLSKRKDLGGYAIQRTFSDIFNFVNLTIADSYIIKDTRKQLLLPLMTPEQRSIKRKNGRIDMHGDSVTGVPISYNFDELISLTVDLASSPAYPSLNINNFNKKHVQYLIHQGHDAQSVLWFINQPILQEVYNLMEKNRRKVQGYTLKHAIAEYALRVRILDNPPKSEKSSRPTYEVYESSWEWFDEQKAEEEGKKGQRKINMNKANPYLRRPYLDLHNQNLSETDVFDFEQMDQAIRNNTKSGDFQKKILAYFASIVDEADELMKLQFANNVDTSKYATLTSLSRNRENRNAIRKTGLFDEKELDRLENETMISPFDYTDKAYKIHKALFPKLYTNSTVTVFSDLIDDVFGVKNIQLERISKIIENDFIEYVYKNFGRYKGRNISDYFENQLVNLSSVPDHQFFSYKFLELRSRYPELTDIPFVSALYENVYYPPSDQVEKSYRNLDNKEIHNLFFLRNPDNPTFEKNIFTSNWRNLISFDPQKFGLKDQYTEEQIAEISDFFHELVYFSLYQAGLTNTGNGFSDLIPYEYWAHFVKDSFQAYETQKELNKSFERSFLRVFEIRFKQMNPKVPWRTKKVITNLLDEEGNRVAEELDFYKNYYRGKDYKITDDDLGFVTTAVYYSDDQLEEVTEEQKSKPPTSVYPVEEGRYVMYGNIPHIVVKRLNTPGVWQLFNPTVKGAAGKIAVQEANMFPLNFKATIVPYGKKAYVVTTEKEIIDVDTNRLVIWTTNSANRKKVLEMANQMNPPTDDIGNVGNTSC